MTEADLAAALRRRARRLLLAAAGLTLLFALPLAFV